MTATVTRLFRSQLPAPAAAPFKGFPKFNFIGGHNDGQTLPLAAMADAASKMMLTHGHDLATYNMQSGPQGFRPLREFVARQLKTACGLRDDADHLMITSGSLQALDLVNKLLLEPGDVVIAEEASYAGAISRIRNAGATCLGVRLDEHGIDVDHLAGLLAEQRAAGKTVKYIYTIPTVQNPTGSVMPTERRKRVLELAGEYDCLIFEDDCYADLLWRGERPPAIRALDTSTDGAGRVIYCGSFSKSLAPAPRVGYLAADWPVLAQMIAIKTDAGSGSLEQMMLAEFCPQHFDSHIAQLRPALKKKCDAMMSALRENFGAHAQFEEPTGGIFIWVTLPNHIDTTRLAELALQQGVAINPGADWTVDGAANRHRLRLCFGHPSEQAIQEGVALLASICHRAFDLPLLNASMHGNEQVRA